MEANPPSLRMREFECWVYSRMEISLRVSVVDGPGMVNRQRTLPRRAKIVVAYKEKPNSAFQIRWEEIGDRTNNEAEYVALLKALGIIESKWGVTGEASGKGAEPIKIQIGRASCRERV